MNEILEKLKEVLEGEASLLIENSDDIKQLLKENSNVEKKFVDQRFEHLTQIIDSVANKSDKFYAELIQVISTYMDQLYDRDIDFCNVGIIITDEELDFSDTICFNSSDDILLRNANRELSKKLFNFLCNILENNKDIILDIETLKRLFNCNPKLFRLSVEKSYIIRTFDFDNLARIINENQTLKKSNININEIYQLLIDTCQVDKEEIIKNLVKPEEYKDNHEKLDELLMWCNARTFIAVTKIIKKYFDNDFDRLSIAKKRNKDKFCESLIIESLHWHADKEDVDLIHQLLTDSEIEIDYDLRSTDFTGHTDLKSIIALSGNKIIIKDLLSKDNNIQNYYHHGESSEPLYNLYARIGNYEKALDIFQKSYECSHDYTEDWNDDFNRVGYTYGDYAYEDSIVSFISIMCASFKEDSIDYSIIIDLINRILNSENVKYINLKKTMTPIQEVLSSDDFKLLVDALLEKHNSGNLGFLVVNSHEGSMFRHYIISLASEDEVQEQLDALNKKEKNKSLIHIKKGDIN